MNQVLFEQFLYGNRDMEELFDLSDEEAELNEQQKDEMRLWLVGIYGFSYEVAKGYIE